MKPKREAWRVVAALLVVAVIALGVTYKTMCPKGFVRFSGYEPAGRFSCIDHGGISTPEHYLSLRDGGRLSFFGAPLAGEGGHPFLFRTGGPAGKWICGVSTSTRFSFGGGDAKIERAGIILDEATASRRGTVTLSGLAGGVFGDDCKSTRVIVDGSVLKFDLELSSAGGGASTDLLRLDLAMSGKGLSIATYLTLDEPWPERGEAERAVNYAWLRLTEVIDGQTVRRIAVAGPGSRLIREDRCARLELENVTPLAVCPSTDSPRAKLELSW